MSVKLPFALALAAFALSSCAARPPAIAQSSNAALTPVAAIARAPELNGQIVRLKGYFTARTDTRALWQNKDAWLDVEQQRLGSYAEHNYWDKCVTVYSVRSFGIKEGYVEIEGRLTIIQKDDIRSFWTCNAVSIESAKLVRS